jgi:hypothetical protein
MVGDEKRQPPSPEAPPTPEELAAAAALRDALSDPSRPHEGADFARAVALANEPRPLGKEEHAAILERALAHGGARRTQRNKARQRVVLAFAGAGALAMAAAVLLRVELAAPRAASVAARAHEVPSVPMAQRRSTQPLFREPFARSGGESARIDRIAQARASDLRDNRFVAWGVR